MIKNIHKPFGQHVKVVAMAILVVELRLKLVLTVLTMMMTMTTTPEQPRHPCEQFVKTEMEKLQLVLPATTDLGLQVKVLVFLFDLKWTSQH